MHNRYPYSHPLETDGTALQRKTLKRGSAWVVGSSWQSVQLAAVIASILAMMSQQPALFVMTWYLSSPAMRKEESSHLYSAWIWTHYVSVSSIALLCLLEQNTLACCNFVCNNAVGKCCLQVCLSEMTETKAMSQATLHQTNADKPLHAKFPIKGAMAKDTLYLLMFSCPHSERTSGGTMCPWPWHLWMGNFA